MGDYTQIDTRSLGQSLQFCQLISVLFVSHKYLVSELNWKLKLPKTYFVFLLYLICQETQPGDSRTFSCQNESTFKKNYNMQGVKQSRRFTRNKKICHGFASVMPPKAWCWHLFMDFSEAAVSVSKSTRGYILKPSSKCINSIPVGSAIKTKKLSLLLERILNLKVRLTCILISFRQYVSM